MRDLETYDAAAANYYNSASRKLMPLLSWDFYIENYSAMNSFKNDLVALKDLGKYWSNTVDFQTALTLEQSVIIVTTPKLEIVYASHNIEQMNGYAPEEVVGKSPKMFQGAETCPISSRRIREAVTNESSFEEVVINYRKDKSIYNCKIKGLPMYDKKGKLVNYIAFEELAA